MEKGSHSARNHPKSSRECRERRWLWEIMRILQEASFANPAEIAVRMVICTLKVLQRWIVSSTWLIAQGLAETGRYSSCGLSSAREDAGVSSKFQFNCRLQEFLRQSSALGGLCNKFALHGSCDVGEKCKFSHDVDKFLKEKPMDLPGMCPFSKSEDQCRYGENIFLDQYGCSDSICGNMFVWHGLTRSEGLKTYVSSMAFSRRMIAGESFDFMSFH